MRNIHSLKWSYWFVPIFSLIDLIYPIAHCIFFSTFIVNFSVLSLEGQTHLSLISIAAFIIPSLFCVARIVLVNDLVLTHFDLSTPFGGNQWIVTGMVYAAGRHLRGSCCRLRL